MTHFHITGSIQNYRKCYAHSIGGLLHIEQAIFTSQQYGYRANRSTELAALELMDRNIDNMNRNLKSVNVYIDLSKAFDCLDHHILLSKLKFYGLSNDAIRLLKNYPPISDR